MDVLIVFGFPFLIVALGIGYGAFQRYLKHKERMAMIEKGLVPPDFEDDGDDESSKRNDRYSPIVVTLVGVALTLGLLTMGIGPWLIGGLVPTAIGCGMLINQILKESREKKGGE